MCYFDWINNPSMRFDLTDKHLKVMFCSIEQRWKECGKIPITNTSMRHLLKVHAEVDAQKVGDQTQYYNINLRMLRIKGYSFKKVRRSQFLSEVHLRDVHSKIVGYAMGNNLNMQFNKQGIQNIY